MGSLKISAAGCDDDADEPGSRFCTRLILCFDGEMLLRSIVTWVACASTRFEKRVEVFHSTGLTMSWLCCV